MAQLHHPGSHRKFANLNIRLGLSGMSQPKVIKKIGILSTKTAHLLPNRQSTAFLRAGCGIGDLPAALGGRLTRWARREGGLAPLDPSGPSHTASILLCWHVAELHPPRCRRFSRRFSGGLRGCRGVPRACSGKSSPLHPICPKSPGFRSGLVTVLLVDGKPLVSVMREFPITIRSLCRSRHLSCTGIPTPPVSGEREEGCART